MCLARLLRDGMFKPIDVYPRSPDIIDQQNLRSGDVSFLRVQERQLILARAAFWHPLGLT